MSAKGQQRSIGHIDRWGPANWEFRLGEGGCAIIFVESLWNAARWHMDRAPIQTASEAVIERTGAGTSVHGLASKVR